MHKTIAVCLVGNSWGVVAQAFLADLQEMHDENQLRFPRDQWRRMALIGMVLAAAVAEGADPALDEAATVLLEWGDELYRAVSGETEVPRALVASLVRRL